MAISILNNIASLEAQNQLSITQDNLQKTLFQLSSGSRINSGADDAQHGAVEFRECVEISEQFVGGDRLVQEVVVEQQENVISVDVLETDA